MQAGIDEFRTVVLVPGADAKRYHELGPNGKPLCGETSEKEWRPRPVFEARLHWYEPCRRRKCCRARDE